MEAATPPAASKRRRGNAPPPPPACSACHSRLPPEYSNPFCPACDLIHSSPGDSPANVLRAAKLAAAASAAAASSASSSSVSSSSQSDTNKGKLGAYEAELRRLHDAAGDPFARFQSAEAISHEAAILDLRTQVYGGLGYAHQSAWLTKLIRSGVFKELSLALPRSNADALRQRTAEAKGSTVLLGASGTLVSTAETHVERSLVSLAEFLKIVIVSILPSLIDRPRASLDWLELARSVIEIVDREHDSSAGWAVANRYLVDVLNDRVPTRTPFNAFDLNLLGSVRAITQQRTPVPGVPAGRPGVPAEQQQQLLAPGSCRNWNDDFSCATTPCRYSHRCMYAACPNPTDGHRGKDCAHKGARAQPRQSSGSGGGRRSPQGKQPSNPRRSPPLPPRV